MSIIDVFIVQFGCNVEQLIVVIGIVMSVMLVLLVWFMMFSCKCVVCLVQKMIVELCVSEEQFCVIVDCIVNWEVWWGLDGCLCWINYVVCDYIGYIVEECFFMLDFIGSIVYLDDECCICVEFVCCMDGQKCEDVEFCCVCKDGMVFWFLLLLVLIVDV